MIITDPKLLRRFRGPGFCEWCRRMCRRDPHHIFAKGMAGGRRLDVAINIIALCRSCHGDVHAGNIQRCDLLAIVAARENRQQGDIEAEIYRLRRRR